MAKSIVEARAAALVRPDLSALGYASRRAICGWRVLVRAMPQAVYSASSLLRIFSVAWAALTRATYSTTSGGASSSASQTTTWTWVWLIISQRARLAGVNVALG
jgi:hypothetical protein